MKSPTFSFFKEQTEVHNKLFPLTLANLLECFVCIMLYIHYCSFDHHTDLWDEYTYEEIKLERD